MEIVDVKIEEHLERRLKQLLDKRMEDAIQEVVKRAIPEMTYALITQGYQNDQPAGALDTDGFGYSILQGPPGNIIVRFGCPNKRFFPGNCNLT